MWVCGNFVYLVPAVILAVQLLSPQTRRANPHVTAQETANHPA